ncbi:MAG: type II secretion system F family protein [Candidatus Omnitrophota bacterium]
MAQYSYRARDDRGELITGTMESESESALTVRLGEMGYSVIDIRSKENGNFSITAVLDRFQNFRKRDIILFTRQIAILLHSGTPLSEALSAVSEQTTNKKLKLIIEGVRQDVQKGENFSSALSKHPEAFSELFVCMVQVGEAGGLLDTILDRVALLGTQEMETQSRIASALVYPVVLVVVAFVVINFLVIGVLPKFVMVFSASGAQLPIPTKIVLGLGWTVRKLWIPIACAGTFISILFKKRLSSDKQFRIKFHAKLLKVPVFGPLYAKIQIARFARVSSALISSGIPILQTLEVVEKIITNFAIRRAIGDIKSAIAQGHSLVAPFKSSGLFSPMVIQMISTGEKSGNIDRMLGEIAGFYEPEVEYTIKNLTSLLEPFMLLTMGLMVGFIALSVLLPIFNLIKVFRG